MSAVHRYTSQLEWSGTTSVGYDDYDRTHRVALPPAREKVVLSSDPAFRGDGALANPEQLLLASVSSCQLLMFLALAARSRIDVLGYEDAAEAIMPEDSKPMRITVIALRPVVTVAPGADVVRVERLIEKAHDGCFVANTISAEITVESRIETGGG